MTDSQTLLAEYARTGSEDAFRDLVKRYIGLVYSSALRLVHGDTHLAEDVTQLVFIDLARKARRLSTKVMLGGWLHQRTFNVAAPILRAERRRHAREKEAVQMNALHTDTDNHLAQVAPILDEAITRLGKDDRKAIILRFFEQRDYRSIGEALGTSSDAAQKRVTRAVAKLHAQLTSRGVTLSAAAIAAALTSQALTAAPAGLAANVARTALAGAATATGSTLALLKYLATTKLKTGIIGALIASGVLIVLFLRQEQNNSAEQRNPSQLSGSENSSGSAATRGSGDSANSRFSPREADAAPVATPQAIVAGKLVLFTRSRRELLHALASRRGIEVPDAVERFFDAIESNRWEEADALFKSLRASDTDCANPRDPKLGKIWRTVQETWGIARESRNWPAQQLLDYGNAVLGSLRPGMIYVGGTDPGYFIPAMLNATSEGAQHIVFTQNALANNDYLNYLGDLYGNQINTLTPDESKGALADYLADYQKRLTHDVRFPDEPKQVRPGEHITGVEPGEGAIDPDKVGASGQDAVMALNEQLLKILMQKNPDMSFAMEASFPVRSTFADAAPLGPIMELRVTDEQNVLSSERARQTVDYWRATADMLNSGPEATDSLFPRMAYAKMASEQAALLLDRGYAAEAEQALRLANEIGPGSPEAFFRLLNLLVAQGRINDALAAAEATYQSLPLADRMKTYYGDNPTPRGPIRTAIEDLKRLQKTK